MCFSRLVIALLFATAAAAGANDSLEELTRRYLIDLVRLSGIKKYALTVSEKPKEK